MGMKLEGMKLKYLSFNRIAEEYKGISVCIDGKEVACGSIDDVLIKLSNMENPHEILHYEVTETRPYFDLFVIALKSEENPCLVRSKKLSPPTT